MKYSLYSVLFRSLPLRALGLAVLFAGCATRPPRDYANRPAVMPPVPVPSGAKEAALPPPLEVDFSLDAKPAPASRPPVVRPQPAPRSGTPYTMRKGESLSAVAARHKMSWRELADYNYLSDPNKVRAGQVILIPNAAGRPAPAPSTPPSTVTTRPSVTPASSGEYVVQAGDALSHIARRNGTTVAQLKSLNQLNSDRILVGQVLKLPAGSASSPASTESTTTPPPPVPPAPVVTPAPALPDDLPLRLEEPPTETPQTPATSKKFTIVVREGDTLESIAADYIQSVEKIRELNNLPPGAVLKPGQQLELPPGVY